ncbi:nitrosoguanidine resistance SNG1 [Fusarium beomiforme]|uniref:Nitrosoguanidine resistance SNG1 n=1 Tax=Fusarium beomiforme TaxID=44412 RepID=A0A9P5AUK7_9HYPO|nr:nitrosoguanidine resistance SNG1 [Fusarium beomiforme]
MSVIPARSSNRISSRSTPLSARMKTYIIPATMVALMVQLLFLANMSYLFGSLFKSPTRMHNLKILAIDYDGSDIGKAISGAYSTLQSDKFPSVEFGSSSEYDTPEKVRDAVCKHGYWGAIYTHPGASDRLLSTIEGDNTTVYNPQDAVTTIYNGAYYPSIFSSLQGNMQSLVGAAATMYALTTPDALKAVNMTNPTSASTLLRPFQANIWNIMPTEQGTRVLLNTVSLVMGILMHFFFQLGMNGITTSAKVLQSHSKRDVYVFRFFTGKIYTLIGALGMTGYFWAFRENWSVDAAQFFETWMCLWFYMDINYLVIDSVLATLIPMQFFSFFLLTWIILNIGSTVFPFELTPGFYHWSWALPAHNAWLLLVGIWSGCRANVGVTLPIMFSWWIVGHAGSAWSVRKRCLMAEAEAKGQMQQDSNEKFERFDTERTRMETSEGPSQEPKGKEYDLEANLSAQNLRSDDDNRTIANGEPSS